MSTRAERRRAERSLQKLEQHVAGLRERRDRAVRRGDRHEANRLAFELDRIHNGLRTMAGEKPSSQ